MAKTTLAARWMTSASTRTTGSAMVSSNAGADTNVPRGMSGTGGTVPVSVV